MKESYGTLSETINALQKLGYILDFNIAPEKIVDHKVKKTLSPDDFEIDKVFRFEGSSNPEDQSVLYAISSAKLELKGLLVNGYGTSSNEFADNLIKRLETHPDK